MGNAENGVHCIAFADNACVISALAKDTLVRCALADDTSSASAEDAIARFADPVHPSPCLAFARHASSSSIAGAVDAGKGGMGDAENGVHCIAFADNACVISALAKDTLVLVADSNYTPSARAEYTISSCRIFASDPRCAHIIRILRDSHFGLLSKLLITFDCTSA
jgi:hypothetical protein